MKVLVIGETCADKFVYCQVNRLSPEAPVPVLNPIHVTVNAGMAGNTAANVKALSPEAVITHLTQEEDIVKTRYVEEKSNHMFLRLDEGETNITPFKWTMAVDMMLGQADIVIVSDYSKGFLSDGDLKEIARKSKLSILDSKRKLTNNITKGFTFIKLNHSERLNNPDLDYNNLIITLGKDGAQYHDELFKSPVPQETIDVSGAGDTFTAAFIINYYLHSNIAEAITFANQKAAEVVSRRGVVVPK